MDLQKLVETIHVYRKTSQGKLKKEEAEYDIDKFVWKVIEKGKPENQRTG